MTGGEVPGQDSPRLLAGISFLTIADLPEWSAGPTSAVADRYAALRKAGYEAVQSLTHREVSEAGLIPTGIGRILDDVDEIRELVIEHRDAGCDCTTLQVGTGLESDETMDRLADAMLTIAAQEGYRLYLETHRATMTQDIWRTLRLVERFPELRFNGDFAHWYLGHELTYGDMDMKFAAMAPVFERTRFLHLRISSNAHAQLRASDPDEAVHLDYYRRMWTAACEGFLSEAKPGEYLAAHPELLPPRSGYPNRIHGVRGGVQEECDRWSEAAFLLAVVRECFSAAKANVKAAKIVDHPDVAIVNEGE